MSAASEGTRVTSSFAPRRSTSGGTVNFAGSTQNPAAVINCSTEQAGTTGMRFSEASDPASLSALISSCVYPAAPGR